METVETSQEQGSVIGGMLLVAGCCFGAGMLGLPVLSAIAGFKPSFIMFLLSWLYMTTTGLLLLEVNLWFSKDVNLVSMAGFALGKIGKAVTWLLFLFLFYCVLVAHVLGIDQLFIDFFLRASGIEIPVWIASIIISFFIGALVYLGAHAVDLFNRILMAGLILSIILLVIMGLPHVDTTKLQHENWLAAPFMLPVLIISFGYHNMVPSLKTYLKGDTKKLKWVIILGAAIPLVVYLVWEFVILGLVPISGVGGFQEALDNGDIATRALRNAVGSSWVVVLAECFAFFAIATSFIAISLSFVDFLADGLHIPKNKLGKALLCLLVLVPPVLMTLLDPGIFLKALNYAGAFGAVILFGIIPALMVWIGRYFLKLDMPRIVPGGKFTLILVMLFSLVVMLVEVIHEAL